MVLPHIVVAMIATQQTITQRSSGLFRWFPQAKDMGQIPLSYHVLKSPAIDVRFLKQSHSLTAILISCSHLSFSPVHQFAPWLELHHVVLLGAPGSSKVFAIDYSPLNQKASLIKLFRGIRYPFYKYSCVKIHLYLLPILTFQ